MRYLSLLVLVLATALYVQGQTSPHGKSFQIDCAQCHTSQSWKVSGSTLLFNHDETGFKLIGQHKTIDCRECHKVLTFKDSRKKCQDCHSDIHNQTLGTDCERCHQPKTWIISDITNIHQRTRFPLLGAHRNVNCSECHQSASKFQFEPLGIECVNCHQKDFDNTKSPNHVAGRYSTDCLQCHQVSAANWQTKLVDHNLFPLTDGHNVGCGFCHTSGKYEKISAACNSCHNKQFTSAQLPKHVEAGVPVKCESCHTTKGWKPSTFNHSSTGYEMQGSHKNVVQCADCHKGNLTTAQQNCISCHKVQYDKAPNHQKAAYPVDCSKCHSQNNWVENSFNHANTNFALTGSHKTVKCEACHTATLAGTPTLCNGCHQKQFTEAQLPAHSAAGIPKECATCHTTNSWKPSSFNHTSTGFELKGAHKSIVQCSLCHKGNVTSAPQTCIGCHQAQYDGALGHKQGGFSTDCTKCHTLDNWLATSFDHSTTHFPLTGAHTKTACSSCHTNGYTNTPATCNSCHLTVYNSAQQPGHVTAGIPKECATCHITASWKPSGFNHTTTGFELKGAHKAIVQCSLCHKGNVTTAPQTCIGCHQAQYDGAPGHKQGGYLTDCTKCHSMDNWLATSFDHSTTHFPLTGAHAKTACSSCHTNGYTNTPATCNSCHLTVYNSAQLPGHLAAGIPKECATCHTTASWKPSLFNHTTTGFELKGAHKTIAQCSLCHKGNVSSAPQTCIGCHQTQYDAAPGHKSGSFSTDCTKCHSLDNWLATNFDHSTTHFPLTGAHTKALCSACHTSGYTNTPATCNSCHLTVYNSSQLPGHLAAGIPKECATCHTTASWKPSLFNHTTTGFELKGAHKAIVQCSLCHKGNVTSAPQTCIGCHQTQYDAAPGHKAGGFATDCTKCHTLDNWLATNFDHSTTSFPLTGAHTKVDCKLCHVSGYKGTPTVCSSCHLAVYTSSQLPAHVTAGIPKECATCHTTTSWKPSQFNHTTTGYELKGAHKTIVQCSLCHKGNVTSAPQTCSGCHQPQYDAALNHKAQGYPVDCTMCHTQNNWLENIFNHATTSFPLTGAHTTVVCSKCHTIGFKGTSTVCYTCHTAKYTASTNPNHLAAKFPTNCEFCHSTKAWTPSTYNHDAQYFPINSGKHKGKWTLCTECHTNAANYAVFSCIVCHEHSSKTSVDKDHSGVKNYVYSGTSCFTCHPAGK